MVSDQNTVRKSIWLAWVLLSIGLITTIVATIYVKKDVEADAKREFDFACIQIQLLIDAQMENFHLPQHLKMIPVNDLEKKHHENIDC
jgi:hypothetical protein